MTIQPRSIFSTGTVKSAFYGFGLTAIAIALPYVSTIAQRYATDKATKDTIADVAGLLTAVFGATGIIGGAGAVVVNRATVDSKDIVYGPSLVPGYSKDEALQCAKQMTMEAVRLPAVEDYIKGAVPLAQLPAVKTQIAQQVAAVMPDMHQQVARMQAAASDAPPQLQPERFLA